MVNEQMYQDLIEDFRGSETSLVAVSKLKPAADIRRLYDLGQRDFGENYVQELVEKQPSLPADIRWHFIGHLQSNKVKYIAPFIHLIQSVDSEKLLSEIDKQAAKNKRIIDCLLQVHIATEQTKFGFNEEELTRVDFCSYPNVKIRGLMGMASFTDDQDLVTGEFNRLADLQASLAAVEGNFDILSMGMSDDYRLAITCGSNLVRIGSLIFGRR